MMRPSAGLFAAAIACAFGARVSAQITSHSPVRPAPTPAGVKRASAQRTAEAPVVDGRLDERISDQAEPITDFPE